MVYSDFGSWRGEHPRLKHDGSCWDADVDGDWAINAAQPFSWTAAVWRLKAETPGNDNFLNEMLQILGFRTPGKDLPGALGRAGCFLKPTISAFSLCCLYAMNRRGAVGAKARMNKLDRRVPQCSDQDALSLLHTSPWSLEPSRAMVNIHMQSILVQGRIPLTLLLREHAVLPSEQKRTKLGRT